MKKSQLFVIVAGMSLGMGAFQPQTAFADNHGHDMHNGHEHSAMGDGHQGHDKTDTVKSMNGFPEKPAVGTKAKCPVLGNEFVVTKDTAHSVYKGKHYVFCCPGCKPKFDKDPSKYIK